MFNTRPESYQANSWLYNAEGLLGAPPGENLIQSPLLTVSTSIVCNVYLEVNTAQCILVSGYRFEEYCHRFYVDTFGQPHVNLSNSANDTTELNSSSTLLTLDLQRYYNIAKLVHDFNASNYGVASEQ
eukprot:UN00662